MKLFNIDLHRSVIADVKDIIKKLYPVVEIVNWSASGKAYVKIINGRTWKKINKEMILRFQDYYDDLFFFFLRILR